MFSFYTLGVMSGAAEEVATGAEVTTTQQIVYDTIQIIIIYYCYYYIIIINRSYNDPYFP